MSTQTGLQKIDRADALQMYGSYPFSTDETYQQGLASILGGGTLDPSLPEDLKGETIRRARVFYFNKITGSTISIDEAREYELSLLSPITEGATETNDENRVWTFTELRELIESGKMDNVPNNKIIPDGLNEAIPSESIAPARKKPWEDSSLCWNIAK